MNVKFKRSFWGYNPADVDKQLKSMDKRYKDSLMELRKQLADEVHQLQLLKVNIEKVKNNIESYKKIENEISRILLKKHLDAVEKVFMAMLDSRRAEKTATDKVLFKKDELTKLKTNIKKVKEEINSVTSRYRLLLESAEGVLPNENNQS
ncbi:MAG: DivIVA protein [Pelotomaculum sp. PtaU1.Bin035]|nr:MAG: DivIVA protein [Pelotomaculum sp. PtaU1.Bin035]